MTNYEMNAKFVYLVIQEHARNNYKEEKTDLEKVCSHTKTVGQQI